MENIGHRELWTFTAGSKGAQSVTSRAFRREDAHPVGSFLELARKVAELQFRNRDHVLLFRGQETDYRNIQGNTTLKPALFRPEPGSVKNPPRSALVDRFDRLKIAEEVLVDRYAKAVKLGRSRLNRHRILRWAILQHYQVCDTPLLDVTHSLRMAASFASVEAGREAFVYVLGVPNLSGATTASSEAGLQIIRLSSVCPPSAIRPHIQEGYLLGEYPDVADLDQKAHYKYYEIDFGRRLVAKFQFDPAQFWAKSGAFPRIERRALYPSAKVDPLNKLCEQVKDSVNGRWQHRKEMGRRKGSPPM